MTRGLLKRLIFQGSIILALLGLVSIPASEAAAPATAAEVGQLLTTLERSPCMFNRNGKWYSASEARAHLEMKFRYFVDQDSISTTEDFINLAATTSSRSGKPYQVQCAGEDPVPSATWLTEELHRIRTGAPPVR